MASKAILALFPIFLLLTPTMVSSFEDELRTTMHYVPPLKAPTTPPPPVVTVPAPPTTPPPPVVTVPTPPPTVKPPMPTPPVKVPPPQPPAVKPPVYPSPPAPIVKSRKDCIPLCGYRCKLHSRKNLCMRACTACCERCKCVPPGTYGNREKCGKCYTDMVTHGNKPKCP